MRPQADRRIERLRTGMKKIKRPDVDRAAREIDPRGRGGFDDHEANVNHDASWFNKFVPSSVRREIGQLLIGSLPATTITPEMRSLAREFQLGGVTFFKRNIEAPEQVAELSHDLQALASDLPPWVAVDQEGGRVARLRDPFTEWPPMATLGRAGDGKL